MEILVNQVYPQKCGDNLKILRKESVKQKNGEYRWECEFVNYPYKKFAYKTHIINGQVENPLIPDKYGFYMGDGIYSRSNEEYIYHIWNHMKLRCYKENYSNYNYLNCEVDSYFKNFQNFCIWFKENSYICENDTLSLDKDVLCNIKHLNIKIYSPETCLLIPFELNSFLAGDNFKSGVVLNINTFRARIIKDKEYKNLGTFDTFKEAKFAYAKEKKKYWCEKLEFYKNIPQNILDILYKYDFTWYWEF